MLPRIKLAQAGDIHLPSVLELQRNLDDKDSRFPAGLKSQISHHPTRRVFEELYRLIEENVLSSVLFMGDLTNIGKLDGYRAGSKYIARALQIGAEGIHASIPV